jgi:hypothetical protein
VEVQDIPTIPFSTAASVQRRVHGVASIFEEQTEVARFDMAKGKFDKSPSPCFCHRPVTGKYLQSPLKLFTVLKSQDEPARLETNDVEAELKEGLATVGGLSDGEGAQVRGYPGHPVFDEARLGVCDERRQDEGAGSLKVTRRFRVPVDPILNCEIGLEPSSTGYLAILTNRRSVCRVERVRNFVIHIRWGIPRWHPLVFVFGIRSVMVEEGQRWPGRTLGLLRILKPVSRRNRRLGWWTYTAILAYRRLQSATLGW